MQNGLKYYFVCFTRYWWMKYSAEKSNINKKFTFENCKNIKWEIGTNVIKIEKYVM